MKFTKIIYFIFFNLFIFNNIYADTAKSENKCNAQNDYLNNQDNKYYQEFNTSNCEDIKLSNPTKYIFCKLKNNNRAVAPALPWIIEGVKDLTIATGAAMASSALLKKEILINAGLVNKVL